MFIKLAWSCADDSDLGYGCLFVIKESATGAV